MSYVRWTKEEQSKVKLAFTNLMATKPGASFAQLATLAQEVLPSARRRKVFQVKHAPFLTDGKLARTFARKDYHPKPQARPPTARRRKSVPPGARAAPSGESRPPASVRSVPPCESSALDRLAAVIRELKADYAAVGAEIDTAIDAAVEDVIGRVRAAHEHVRALRSISTKEAPMPPSEVTPRTRADAPPRRRDPLTSVARRRRKVRSGAQAVRNAGPAPEPTRGASSKSQPEDRAASSSSDGETDPSRTGSALKRASCRAHAETGHEPSCSSCRIAEIRAAHERVSHA